jgi:hypothetical protein
MKTWSAELANCISPPTDRADPLRGRGLWEHTAYADADSRLRLLRGECEVVLDVDLRL